MMKVTRENLLQARRELVQGATQLKSELDAYEGTIPELYQSSALMCEAILEYCAAEDLVEQGGG